jgi:hypothetical protein
MGHVPIAMEDYVAEGARPVDRCLDDVARCDAFVGVLAWRYGYAPEATAFPAGLSPPVGAVAGVTSITELEYRQAVASE